MDYVGGTDTLLTHRFVRSGEPFVPDTGTVKYTVSDHDAVPISGLVNVPVTTNNSTFQITFVVTAINNAISLSKDFERRFVSVSYERDGQAYTDEFQYRLRPATKYSVSAQDVRSFIGLQDKELEDFEIDLFNSYLIAKRDLGTISIDTLLSSGTIQELAANGMIKAQAVLSVLPSVKQRMAQEETNGVTGFKRVQIKDLLDVELAARNLYANALTELVIPVDAALTLVLTTTDADPITG